MSSFLACCLCGREEDGEIRHEKCIRYNEYGRSAVRLIPGERFSGRNVEISGRALVDRLWGKDPRMGDLREA